MINEWGRGEGLGRQRIIRIGEERTSMLLSSRFIKTDKILRN